MSGSASTEDRIKVMVVDDSAIVRGLLVRTLERGADDIEVVASVGDGQMALNTINRHDIDVVLLDIEMPRMDGLTALPKLIEACPGIKVIMASTLTLRNAEISIRALEMGAADYIPKPGNSAGGLHSAEDFQRELIEKVRTLGRKGRAPRSVVRDAAVARLKRPKAPIPPRGEIILRPAGPGRPDILAIGSSTGGPRALQTVLKALPSALTQPIVITQHMPATFTTILADHISQASGRPCTEGKDGMAVEQGHIYVAPGDYHMVVEPGDNGPVIRLNQDEPENFCRPAVDVMLRSVASVYGAATLVMILTGMGYDGWKGSEVVVETGGTVIAQDEETSVVWGMPGAVAMNGLCSDVLPLAELGPYLCETATRAAA